MKTYRRVQDALAKGGRAPGRTDRRPVPVSWLRIGVAVALGVPALAIGPHLAAPAAAALPSVETVGMPGAGHRLSSGATVALDDGTLVVAATDLDLFSLVSTRPLFVRSRNGAWSRHDVTAGTVGDTGAVTVVLAAVGGGQAVAVWNAPVRGTDQASVFASIFDSSTGQFSAPTLISSTAVVQPPGVAVAGGVDGSATLVYARQRAGGGRELVSHSRLPGALSWSGPAVLPAVAPTNFAAAGIGWVGGGRYLAQWQVTTEVTPANARQRVESALLEPGGSWSGPVTLMDQTLPGGTGFSFNTWGGGNAPGAVVLWNHSSAGVFEVRGMTYSVAGGSWSAVTMVATGGGGFGVGSSPTGPGAVVTIAQFALPIDPFDPGFPTIVARSYDGLSWGPVETVAPPAGQRQSFAVSMSPDGSVFATGYNGTLGGIESATRARTDGPWVHSTELLTDTFAAAVSWGSGAHAIVWSSGGGIFARVFDVAIAPKLSVSIDLLDGAAPPLDERAAVGVAVTVSASADGVGDLTGLRFDQAALTSSPADIFGVVGGPTPTPPTGGFSLSPGQSRTFTLHLQPNSVGRYTLLSKVDGKDASGTGVSAVASSPGVIGAALQVSIELDPPFADQAEGPDGPTPVDVTATIKVKNNAAVQMTAVTLTSLRVDRTKVGQGLAITQTGGVEPGADGVLIGTLASGEERVLTATFRAADDAEAEFSAMATAALPGGGSEIGIGKKRWSLKPKYLLRVETLATNPRGGLLLPAGETIRVTGTVRNLSNTATLDLGPLYPTLFGNAGVSSLTYDTLGSDPRSLLPVGRLTLAPSESREFSVRVTTSWSDPARIEGDGRHGGTSATVLFTPYGRATLDDGTAVDIEADQIDNTAESLTHRIAIDDSITIPTFEFGTFASGVLVGGLEGVWNATSATLWGLVDVVTKLPYTTIAAAAEYQSRVWSSFTSEEKEAFINDAAFMTYSVLIRNAEFGVQDAGTLLEQVNASTLQSMTAMENQWQIGNYADTARLYTSFGTNAIAQVAVPVALGKLATSPRAAAALVRAQRALQGRMAPVLSDVAALERLEQVGPVLQALESGLELLPEQLAVLYGITAEELAELQALATKYDFLLTVRSRHESSIEWIERFNALLKPEAIKIKSVSELDVALGYRKSDLGSLVFRKPEPLRLFEAGQGDLGALINDFVQGRGFAEGTGEWDNAVDRLMARITEWRKYEGEYKAWDARGWTEVSFNYKGNAIGDSFRRPPSAQGVAQAENGKYIGFNLEAIGEEEFVVQLKNDKLGRFVPVTGDIDPIAFTHVDGSPLTELEHLNLLENLRTNPLLKAQHGESATFVKGGVDFTLGQFKPGEPGLQIAPGGHAPRVVRLNAGKSRWTSAHDYHLHWDGGFVYSGSYVPRGAIPRPSLVVPPATLAPAARPRPLPRAVGAEPNVGRCLVSFSTAPGTPALVLDAQGHIAQVVGGQLQPSPLDAQCFGTGEVLAVNVLPTTEVLTDAVAGADRVEIPTGDYVAGVGGAGGLAVGQEVTVGAGTPNAETLTIAGFGSIVFTNRLLHPHAAGEPVVVTNGVPAPVNRPPVCDARSGAVLAGSSVDVAPSCTDPDGDALTYDIGGQGAFGTASVITGRLRYTASIGSSGPDTFTYTANDGKGATSAPAPVTITITAVAPPNRAPVCAPLTGSAVGGSVVDLAPSCTDPDGDGLAYSIVKQGSKGTAAVASGLLRYTPKAKSRGTDTFTYRASDGRDGTSPPATVTITLTPAPRPNRPPMCRTRTGVVVAGRSVYIEPSCTDPDGDALTYTIVGQAAKGTASVVDGKLWYDAANGSTGPDSFKYTATDTKGSTSLPAYVAIAIIPAKPCADRPRGGHMWSWWFRCRH